jgi:hypothetical protein
MAAVIIVIGYRPWNKAYAPSKSVVGFLILVELCKGLVLVSYLISSVEMNGKSRSLGKWITRLVGKDVQPQQNVKLVYQPCSRS